VRREPSASELLGAWELGLSQPPLERPLTLLAAGRDVDEPESLAELPIGRRDAKLLELRREVFGTSLVALAPCPACGERLELAVDVDDVTLPPDEKPAKTYTLAAEGHSVTFRLPTTADLLVADAAEPEAARARLLERCVLDAEAAGRPVAPARLPPAVVEAVSERMRSADPQAEVEVALRCPACDHGWSEQLDIGSFLWEEVDTWARRLLQDVAVLAKAYGWTEADVIGMSPARRQAYLDLVGT
jgi:hypothetical protein